MFVGGIRALLLQSLHPLAMAGVAAHSGYQGRPVGPAAAHQLLPGVDDVRHRRTTPRQAVDRIRSVHERVRGVAPDGRPYAASDPHLLRWVHVAEVDSFLRAYQRYGSAPLDQAGRDGYVLDAARVARALGVDDPPKTEART